MISHEQKKDILIKNYIHSAEFEDKMEDLRIAVNEYERKKKPKQEEQMALI